MRSLLLMVLMAAGGAAQTTDSTEANLGWRMAIEAGTAPLTSAMEAAAAKASWIIAGTAQVALHSDAATVGELRRTVEQRRYRFGGYRIGSSDDVARAIEVAAQLGAGVVIVPQSGRLSADLERVAAARSIRIAVEPEANGPPDVSAVLGKVRSYGAHFAVWVNPELWQNLGTRTTALLPVLKDRLAGGFLAPGAASDEVLKEAYRLDLKPLLWAVPASQAEGIWKTVAGLVAYHTNYAGRTPGVRRLAGISDEERKLMEAALPASAVVKPQKARRLLVFDLNVGRPGHPSIPYANLAMDLIGQRTGAFTATVSSDPAILQPERLREFDAVYLNNTIGDIFPNRSARDAFATFLAEGGGLMANHAATVTETGWDEFGMILGARGASHRMADENVMIQIEDAASPLTAAFDGKPFVFSDEIFRFQQPYSRDRVRVLLSVNSLQTDMMQGRCFGQCLRDDNDYPVAWIRQYGKGRVFYTTLGHNSYVFWDAKMLRFFLAAAQYVLGDLNADATPRAQPATDWSELLSRVSRYEFGQDRGPVRDLDRAMGMLGKSAEAARRAEAEFIRMLGSNATQAGKDAVCRQLAIIGSADAVPVLAKMLMRKETVEMARYALEGIQSPLAAKALREALPKAEAPVQPGILQSLARRRDTESVSAIAKLVASPDRDIAIAAANALGMIGTADAEKALLAAKRTPATENALLTLAEGAGAERAGPLYRKLVEAGWSEETRVAAVHGLGRQQNTDALKKALADASAKVRRASILELAVVSPQALTGSISKLPDAEKTLALGTLFARRDTSALAALREAIGKEKPAVRVAAIQGLAEVGTAAEVPLLVEAASTSSVEEQAAARFALTRMRAAGVDEAIVQALPAAGRSAKIELIRASGARGASSAAPALVQIASGTDAALRREALRALNEVARPEHAIGLLQLLLQSAEDDRPDAAQALAAAVRRGSPPATQPLAAALRATTDAGLRVALIQALALTGAKDALPVLRDSLQTAEAAERRAAVNGLAQWTSPEPMEDLIAFATRTQEATLQVLALRGYLQLVQIPVGRAPADTAKLLQAAMQASRRPDEKKSVLAALQRVVCPESLAIARAAEDDPAVSAEAKSAVTALTRALAARAN